MSAGDFSPSIISKIGTLALAFMPGIQGRRKQTRALALNIKNMAYVKNWLHCVWGTKNRIHFLNKELRTELIRHIRENAKTKNIYIDSIDGSDEHLHCLISLGPDPGF